MPTSRRSATKPKTRNKKSCPRANGQTSTLPFMPSADERLDVSMLETWLWDAACAIRGATDAPKRATLPRRLSQDRQLHWEICPNCECNVLTYQDTSLIMRNIEGGVVFFIRVVRVYLDSYVIH